VLPAMYEGDPHLISAIGLAVLGFILIFAIERLAAEKSVK
jgi:hypothetical protein